MTWTSGYVSDVRYPAFFYKEMQPAWLSTMATFQGFVAPDLSGDFALLELGCGQGVNTLVAAACHPQARFVGVDFNAENLDAARSAADACGIGNVAFVQRDFATYAGECDQAFDFVTCHGVWSWIAPEDRAFLLESAVRSLVPGGLLYLHYMCHPGSTDVLPLQHLLNLCAHHMPGPSPRKAQTGMKLLEQISRAGGFADRPAMQRHIANMARRDPADLAHEFLADHWQPQHSADVHQQVGRAGLAYIGSADAFDNLDVSLSIPSGMQALVQRTAVPALAETLKDIARNAHQRMDLFQKDPLPLTRTARAAALETIRFSGQPGVPPAGRVTFATPIGPITGPEELFGPLLASLAAGPASVAALAQLPVFAGDAGSLLQSLQLLMMQQMAHPAVVVTPPAFERAARLSQWFARHGVALRVTPECGTAVPQAEAG